MQKDIQDPIRMPDESDNQATHLLASLQGEPDNLNSQVALVYVLLEYERQQAARDVLSNGMSMKQAHQNRQMLQRVEGQSQAI